MSAFGTKRTCWSRRRMSAFGGKADIYRTRTMLWFSGKSNQLVVLNSQASIDATEYTRLMSHERSNSCSPQSPRCPNCGQAMRLAGITSRFDDLADVYTFECRSCGVSHIEPDLSALILDPIQDDQLSEKPSLPTLFGKLDALEGGHLLRGFRKRRQVH